MPTLDTPLDQVKGVGEKTYDQFSLAGIRTVRDLVYFFPRTHEDYSQVQKIAGIRPGKVSVQGRFQQVNTRRVRRGMSVTEAVLVDATSKVTVVWFNQPYRAQQLAEGKEWLVTGEFGLQRSKYQIVNPACEAIDGPHISGGRIVPVYRAVKGLKPQLVRKIVFELKPLITMLPETLPPELVAREKLMSHADAVLAQHFPESAEELQRSRQRLGFEELLALMLASVMNRDANDRLEGWHIPFDEKAAKAFVAKLPFELTGAQKVGAWEIIKNFESAVPMNRLLQGDVGAGKTVVAGMAAYLAAQQGFQTALMAPTELLATQHAATLDRLLAPFHVTVGLLTGSVTAKQRKVLLPTIADGSIAVVIGTHALFQETVTFHKLGFVVIDEQHRFGVEQRQRLLAKGHKMPHLLAMTATPIPRSLQLTVYGELDISLIRERPKGRKPIITEIISPNSRTQMEKAIEEQLANGQQAYVVCPLIEDQTKGDASDIELKSVQTELKQLQAGGFRHRTIGLLHGKLSAEEKQSVMSDFADGKTDILVSTTVVEVGVDVPNATVMVIEGAERFGLAQLHQLRGRVGRSDLQSYCYLVPSTSQRPSQRLREMTKSNDGFYLAERDLELRGPGEIYGRAQSGQLNLAMANLANTTELKRAKGAAEWLIKQGIDLPQYDVLRNEVERYRRLTTLN